MKLLENGAYCSPKDEGYSKQSTSQKAKKERIRKFHSLLAATIILHRFVLGVPF